jgi:Ca-activated chloride channel family protein
MTRTTDLTDDLLIEMRDAVPQSDAARRRANLAAASEIFIQSKETEDLRRRRYERAEKRPGYFAQGVAGMTRFMKRTILMGSTGIVTAGLAVVLFFPEDNGPDMTVADTAIRQEVSQPERLVQNHANDSVLMQSESLLPDFARNIQNKVTGSQPRVAQAPMSMRMPDVVAPQISESRNMFPDVDASDVKTVLDDPVSTFSIDVDTASWSTVRSMINRGRVPPADAVRIEEMVNYFNYGYAAPEGDDVPFSASVSTSVTPWNNDTRLVRLGLQGEMPVVEDRPALDLVFLIDTSGSMRADNKLGLLRQSFKMVLPELGPQDRVGIVTYAGVAGTALEMTSASDRTTIMNALDKLAAGGSTAGAAGLRAAYDMIEASTDENGSTRIGRVLLATDGDFNVGMSSTEEMEDFIAQKRDSGAYLTVLGYGMGNLNDSLMQTLAQTGNGQAAHIDTLGEARKVLVDQLAGALYPIANDVKIQVEFNPAVVAEYRLIGYETRALNREDFNNDKVDAGEIGAGHQVTALYEITPVGSPAILNDPLRYGGGDETATAAAGDEAAFLKMRYKEPGESRSQLIEVPISAAVSDPDLDTRFAAAIAGFGQIMKDESYVGSWSISDAIELATASRGDDPFGYRAEAVQMMRLYESLSKSR